MLGPHDYAKSAIFHPVTRKLMEKIDFSHGTRLLLLPRPSCQRCCAPLSVVLRHAEVLFLCAVLSAGGPKYDALYPDGIPTSIVIKDNQGASWRWGSFQFGPPTALQAAVEGWPRAKSPPRCRAGRGATHTVRDHVLAFACFVAGRSFDSGLVMYPGGHARNTTADLDAILKTKFALLGGAHLLPLRRRFLHCGLGAVCECTAAEP